MEGDVPEIARRVGRILILSEQDADVIRIAESVSDRMPETEITRCRTVDELHALLNSNEIDVAVIDHRIVFPKAIEIVQAAKVKDHAPSVVFISGIPDPAYVSRLYEAGCHKYFLENEEYGPEMAHVIRGIMWVRKLQEQNTRLISKLTEANILLEEKNRRLDEFSATVAHDIRGPLGGVVMKLDYALERYRDEINEQFASVLNRALQSSQRLTEIVQAMYEFAKLGSKAAKMGPVPLGRLVEEVIKDMNFDEAKDISFVIGELPVVWGNDQLLRRVFINLFGNSVKYSDKAETIIAVQPEGSVRKSISDFARISVGDNGPGIDEKELKDVFRFFSRGSAGRKDNEGLGVGLTVVQRIMELHFGAIEVSSPPGSGAKFVISLPVDKIDFIK